MPKNEPLQCLWGAVWPGHGSNHCGSLSVESPHPIGSVEHNDEVVDELPQLLPCVYSDRFPFRYSAHSVSTRLLSIFALSSDRIKARRVRGMN